MHSINIWAILVATVVAFVIGTLWYSPVLFGKEWMRLTNVTDKDVEAAKAKGGMWKSYLAQLVATLVSFAVLGFIVTAASGMTAVDGAFMGFLVWIGFYVTLGVGAVLWDKRPMRLVMIQLLCSLVTLVIGGAIIGGWH